MTAIAIQSTKRKRKTTLRLVRLDVEMYEAILNELHEVFNYNHCSEYVFGKDVYDRDGVLIHMKGRVRYDMYSAEVTQSQGERLYDCALKGIDTRELEIETCREMGDDLIRVSSDFSFERLMRYDSYLKY